MTINTIETAENFYKTYLESGRKPIDKAAVKLYECALQFYENGRIADAIAACSEALTFADKKSENELYFSICLLKAKGNHDLGNFFKLKKESLELLAMNPQHEEANQLYKESLYRIKISNSGSFYFLGVCTLTVFVVRLLALNEDNSPWHAWYILSWLVVGGLFMIIGFLFRLAAKKPAKA